MVSQDKMVSLFIHLLIDISVAHVLFDGHEFE